MKKLADLTSKTEEIPLLTKVQGYLTKKQAAETSDRRQDIIHPSEMAKLDWCPRQTYYRIAETPEDKAAKTRIYGFTLANIFEEGHTIHRKYQGWLADMGILWGDWRCPICPMFTIQETGPVICKGMLPGHIPVPMEYREVTLESDKYLIAGHADGAIPDGMIEIKSIGLGTLRFEHPDLLDLYQVTTTDGKKVFDIDGLWKGIRRPLPSHLRQGNIYLRLAEEMGLGLPSMTFIYEFKPNQQVKEFTVKHSSRITDPLFESALDIKYALKVNRPPDRPEHGDSPNAPVCKACPFTATCWGLSDSASEAGTSGPADEAGAGDADSSAPAPMELAASV